MQKSSFPCVILSGGKSSRMGEDKALLNLHDMELTSFLVLKMQAFFKAVFVSTKENKFKEDLRLILDIHEASSPMVALDSIFSFFIKKNYEDFIFIQAVDMPKVDEYIIKSLEKALFLKRDKYKMILARGPFFKHPLCGFYHTQMHSKTKELLKDDIHKLSALSELAYFLPFEDEESFLNLNYYDDFLQYKKSLLS